MSMRAEAQDVSTQDLEQFIFREARLMDEHCYDEWESLWTDDGVYWVPIGTGDYDPLLNVSVIYDDRDLIAARVRRLSGRFHYAGDPPSSLTRVVSNVERDDVTSEGDVIVRSAFVLYEARRDHLRAWPGRNTHHLRPGIDGELSMSYKKVVLVNGDQGLPNASFLL